MATININGNIYNGNNIVVRNGVITIDGVDQKTDAAKGVLEVRVLGGSIGELTTDAAVNCEEVRGNVISGGSVNCNGVGGDVRAGGSVNCDNIGGSVNAGGSINRG